MKVRSRRYKETVRWRTSASEYERYAACDQRRCAERARLSVAYTAQAKPSSGCWTGLVPAISQVEAIENAFLPCVIARNGALHVSDSAERIQFR